MFHQPFPFLTPRRHPNSLVLQVTLRGAPERRRRRAFFGRMHREARRLGVVLSQKLGLCVFFGAERICTTAHRQQMVYWLVDQPEVAGVEVGQLGHLGDLFDPDLIVPSGANDREGARPLIHRVAFGVVIQWICYLTGAVE